MDQWKTAEAVTRAMAIGVIQRQNTIGSEMVWLFSLLFASRLKICSCPWAVRALGGRAGGVRAIRKPCLTFKSFYKTALFLPCFISPHKCIFQETNISTHFSLLGNSRRLLSKTTYTMSVLNTSRPHIIIIAKPFYCLKNVRSPSKILP